MYTLIIKIENKNVNVGIFNTEERSKYLCTLFTLLILYLVGTTIFDI